MSRPTWRDCDRCNYDMHLCPGCGEPLPHDVSVCEDCREEQSTTTDKTELQERIARALYENAEYYGPAPTQPPWDWRDDEERGEWMKIAAAVLPLIAAEVRKGRADALRRAAGEMDGGYNTDTLNLERRQIKRWLRARADAIEQEG